MVSSFKGSGLLGLSQGNRTTTNYAIGSCRKFCQSDWNSAVQCNAFLLGQGDCGSDEVHPWILLSEQRLLPACWCLDLGG